ncbi:MAG: hypothetical protein FD188_3515, partial [Ignavibacteria bacterium]
EEENDELRNMKIKMEMMMMNRVDEL